MTKQHYCCSLFLSLLLMGNSLVPYGTAHANSQNYVGVIEQIFIDYENSHELVHYIKTEDNQFLKLNLTNLPNPPELNSGALVRVSGNNTGSEVLVFDIEIMTFVPQQLTPLAIEGNRTIGVFLVNFTDNTEEPYTPAEIVDKVTEMDSWFQEVSYGKYSHSLDPSNIYGYYTIDNPYTGSNSDCSDVFAVWTSIINLTNSDPNVNPYEFGHSIIVMASPGPCRWAGVASVGGTFSVIRARRNLNTWVHEIGHNLSLRHSSSANCGDVDIQMPITNPPCRQSEYGDRFDAMGNGSSGHYNAYQKEKIGWLDQSNILSVSQNGIYTLSRYPDNDNLPKAIKITSNDGNVDLNYWFEYRQPVGKDSVLGGSSFETDGLLTHIQSNYEFGAGFHSRTSRTPLQLDMTPDSNTSNTGNDFKDGVLPTGQSFTDPGQTGFTITPTNQTATSIDVEVRFGGGTGPLNRAPVVQNRTIKVQQDTSYPIVLTGTDADNDPLEFSITKQPNHGTLIGSSPRFTYQPNAGFLGDDDFEYKANDGTIDSNIAKISLDVQTEAVPPPDDIPGDTTVSAYEPIKNVFNKDEQVMVQCQKPGGLNIYSQNQERVASVNCPEVGSILPINSDISSGTYFTDDGRKIIRLK